MEKNIFETKYNKGTIEHRLQPDGGRDLATYEKQLMFDRKDLEGKKILDLGAGPEIKLTKELKKSGINAEVISLSPDFSEKKYAGKVKTLFPDSKLVAGVGQTLPFSNESFDRIFAFHVDEHITREMFFGFISEMARTLKDGGEAKLGPTLNIPNEWNPYQAILDDKELIEDLNKKNIEIIKEPISEEVMPKTSIKDSYGGRWEESSYNIVLKKSSSCSNSSSQI